MKILFYTFPEGHLVSDKEFDSLKKGFAKVRMELIRWHKDYNKTMQAAEGRDFLPVHDIVLVKGWSHLYADIPVTAPIVYLSIGTEWKLGENLKSLNEPLRDLYHQSQAIIHISKYCQKSHRAVWPKSTHTHHIETVIIPAKEPNLPKEYIPIYPNFKLATTCIPRPVKRIDELERLCKEEHIELVPAWGGVSDFSYYHQCHGYIHLSRKEGMPNTVLEAMAMGLPCIVTNYGGAKEAVGDSGIVIKNDPENVPWDPANIEPIDRELFVDAIERFRQQLPELRVKVRERVRTELNDYVTACKFKEVFDRLI